MNKLYYSLACGAVFFISPVFISPLLAQTVDTPEQTKNGTIIWHLPRTGQATPPKSGGSETIIWDDAKAGAPQPAPSSAQTSPRSSAAPSGGAPDRNGIIWNDPPGAKTQTAAVPLPPVSAPAPAPASPPGDAAAGPCREFDAEVTIEGQRQPMRGTACRQPDGRWRVVSQVPR